MNRPDGGAGRPAWLKGADPDGVVISARVRLARNAAESAFPGWAGDEECARLCRRLERDFAGLPAFAGGRCYRMEDLGPLDRQVLRERHLISTELAGKGAGSAVWVSADETLSAMINEEDHLRLQSLGAGGALDGLWQSVDALDTAIEGLLPYAFSNRLGYLTACPTNVGTGMRASVMLHLPGLRLAGDLEKTVKGLGRIGLAIRGLLGEGTDALGGMYQISNQTTLGVTEPEILASLRDVTEEVAGHERRARQRLIETRPALLRDRVARSLALLTRAALLGSEEALDLLSGLRLGLALGWLRNLDVERLDGLFMLAQPAHLQTHTGRALAPEERDERRAALFRERLAGVEWV